MNLRNDTEAESSVGTPPSRRAFLGGTGAALVGALAAACASGEPRTGDEGPRPDDALATDVLEDATRAEAAPQPSDVRPFTGRMIVSTWRFGQAANAAAWAALASGVEHPVDAAVEGVKVTEADPSIHSVGLGGFPNRDGVVQLDSHVMRGDTLATGAVAALENVLHPVDVARDVMLHTPHVLLVGAGALAFARERGHAEGELLTPEARASWETWKAKRDAEAERPADSHDTIGMIVFDGARFGTALTTSGWAWKLPGRVGDSPIVGAGGYCDDEAGACVATGDGEEMIRTCSCFAVVDALRRGVPVEEALAVVVRRVRERAALRGTAPYVALLAVDRAGRAAGLSSGQGFQFALTTDEGTRLVDAPVLA